MKTDSETTTQSGLQKKERDAESSRLNAGVAGWTNIAVSNGLPENGWLMAEEHEWFHAGYNYAATQSCAIPALAIISAEQAHSIVTMIIRGARMHGHKIPDVLP